MDGVFNKVQEQLGRMKRNIEGKENHFLSFSEWVGLTSPSHKIFTKVWAINWTLKSIDVIQ